MAGSMVGVRLGLSEHINDSNVVFSLVLDEDDVNSIQEVLKKGKVSTCNKDLLSDLYSNSNISLYLAE